MTKFTAVLQTIRLSIHTRRSPWRIRRDTAIALATLDVLAERTYTFLPLDRV